MAKELDQLTMDSIAAQKAGMSYGMWKALHPNTKVVENNQAEVAVPQGELRYCLNCGEQISPYAHRNSLYCCPECAYAAKRARAIEHYHTKKERMMAIGKV